MMVQKNTYVVMVHDIMSLVGDLKRGRLSCVVQNQIVKSTKSVKMTKASYENLFRLIDSHKFLNDRFNNHGALSHIFDWFFPNTFNHIFVTPVYDVKELNVGSNCAVFTIEDFYVYVMLSTDELPETHTDLLLKLLKVKTHYTSTNDNVGLELINKVIMGYYSYISGQEYSYMKLIKSLFDSTIDDIQQELRTIDDSIELKGNHIIVDKNVVNDTLHEYFTINGWENVHCYQRD